MKFTNLTKQLRDNKIKRLLFSIVAGPVALGLVAATLFLMKIFPYLFVILFSIFIAYLLVSAFIDIEDAWDD